MVSSREIYTRVYNDSKAFNTTRVRIIDENVINGVDVPEYTPPKFWGSLCQDKVTFFRGICVQRRISLFNADQYVLTALYNKDSLLAHEEYLIVDEGRIIEIETADGRLCIDDNEKYDNNEEQKALSSEEVKSSRNGGLHDYSHIESEVRIKLLELSRTRMI